LKPQHDIRPLGDSEPPEPPVAGSDGGGEPAAEGPGSPKLLRIGQLAERCGKTVRALHLYEELGLLRPVLRSKGGFRLYSATAVERVQWIGRLQEAEVSLGEIQGLLRELEEERIGASAMTRLRDLLQRKLVEVREQQRKLAQLAQDLSAGLHYLDGCRVCEPEHTTSECTDCKIHGHDGNQPLMVAGVRTT
jgi:MerR family copper efflux transcriptional regulator